MMDDAHTPEPDPFGGQPVRSLDLSITDAAGLAVPPPPPKRRLVPVAAVAAFVTLAAIGIGAALVSRLPDRSGAESPQAAVQGFFDALNDENLVDTVFSFPPEEADPLVRAFGDVGAELRRLEVLPEGVDPRSLPGFDLEFTDLVFEPEPLAEGLTAVHVVGGHAYAALEPDELPLGDLVTDYLPPAALDELGQLEPAEAELSPADDLFLVAVEREDGWYVSWSYTLAEFARREAGAPLPDFGNRVVARGAASPEAAVEEMIRAGARLDVRRVLELLPPGEARALHDYAPLFLDGVELNAEDYDVTIDTLALSSEATGVRAVVTIEAVEVSFSDPVDALARWTIAYDGECATVLTDFGDGFGLSEMSSCDPELQGMMPLGMADPISVPEIVTVQVDGQWYVSPIESSGHWMTAGLAALERSTIDAFLGMFLGQALFAPTF